MTTLPTASEIRQTSKMQFASYQFGTPTGSDPDPLNRLIVQAGAEIQAAFLHRGLPLYAQQIPMNSPMDLLYQPLVRMWVEYLVALAQPETPDASGAYEYLSSTRSGAASDTYRDVGSKECFHPFPPIDRLASSLWSLWEDAWPIDEDGDGSVSGVPGLEIVGVCPPPGESIVHPEPWPPGSASWYGYRWLP